MLSFVITRQLLSSVSELELQILLEKFPWPNRREAEVKLMEFQNPPRPVWPANVPDDVWNFIERCWSPRAPRNRPSAQEVLPFVRDRLQQLLQPKYVAIMIFLLHPDP